MPELVVAVDVAASPEVVFDAATDWGRHGEWMLGTSVAPVSLDGAGVGAASSTPWRSPNGHRRGGA